MSVRQALLSLKDRVDPAHALFVSDQFQSVLCAIVAYGTEHEQCLARELLKEVNLAVLDIRYGPDTKN